MKKGIYILSMLATLFLATSCEDVIELDLKSTEPRVVIDAVLDGSDGTLTVRCSETVDFYNNNIANPITGALITLSNHTDKSYTIGEVEPGLYVMEGYEITSNLEYTLDVIIDDVTYTATAVAPFPSIIQEVVVLPIDIQGPPDTISFYTINAGWFDVADIENYYRVILYQNGLREENTYSLINDKENDGGLLYYSTLANGLDVGDEISIELLSIDKEMYQYFEQVSDMQSNGFSAAAPYNPTGNFSNDILGYFGICYSNKKEVVVQ